MPLLLKMMLARYVHYFDNVQLLAANCKLMVQRAVMHRSAVWHNLIKGHVNLKIMTGDLEY